MYSLTVHCQRLCHQYFSLRWRREMTALLPHPLRSLLQQHCILLLPSTSVEDSACLALKWWISLFTCLEYQLKMIHLEWRRWRRPRFDSERQTVIPDSHYWCLRLLKVPSNSIAVALGLSWCGVTFSQDWKRKEPPPPPFKKNQINPGGLIMHHHGFSLSVTNSTAVMQQVHSKQLQIVHQGGWRSIWIN